MGSARFLLVGVLLLVSPLLGYPDEPTSSPSGASSTVQTPYHTEQEWIISSVCRNAFELLAYAKDKKGEQLTPEQVVLKAIPGDILTYDVTIKGAHEPVEVNLQWPGSIWDPTAYLPFCQAAIQALKFKPDVSGQPQGDPLHVLLDFSETAIEAENQRVSHWLAEQPGNPAAHEQAALVLGTLAMKENSGYFWDPRDECNHVCAHLAVANFLREGADPSVEGRLADCLVGLIVDTKTKTGKDLDQLAAEKSPPADLAAWINAGRMRNTRDWRLVKEPEKASKLEQVEYFRALAEAVDPERSIAWLQKNNIANCPDWTRIVLEMGFSVEAGHTFAENSIAQEVHTMQATFPGSFENESIIRDLNEAPGDAINFDGSPSAAPTVISKGMWAQFFQRHLFHAIAETGNFFANKWDVPETTQAMDQAVDKTFSSLTFYPYLQMVQQQMRQAPASPATELALFTSHPELGPDFLVQMKLPSDADSQRLQQCALAWFSPAVIQGTAYGAMSRMPEAGWDKKQADQLYAMAPLQFSVAQLELKKRYGDQFTYAQVQEVMGPLLDYFVPAINEAKSATGLTFDQQIQLAEKTATFNPDSYFELGSLYRNNHQEEKAAEAYQKWFDQASDRVEVANGIEWLVEYDYDHGQPDKAMALAKDAADVYSSRGLQTMMHLLEKMGRLDDAEGYGQKIQERYNEIDPLASFYKRHADKGEGRFQAKFDDLALTVFPFGMKKVTLASFSGPPSSGMTFTDTNDAMKSFGLSSSQVIVALDGYAVQSQAQYTFIRGLTDSPEMHFIVWDGRTYREITANQPERRFGVDTQDYHP